MDHSPFIYETGVRDGTPLVFFHGFPGSHKQADLIVPHALKLGLRVLAPDRPGYGFSEPMPGKGLREFAVAMERALDRLGVDRFYVLGVSGGNPAAVSLAAHMGARVLGLGSLCGLAPYPESRDLLYKFARTGFEFARKTPEFFMRMTINSVLKGVDPKARVTEMMSKLSPADQEVLTDPAVRESLFASVDLALKQGGAGLIFDLKSVTVPWPVDFSSLKCPYLLWHGTEDRVLPHSLSELLHAKVPGSKLKLFAGEGHYSLPLRFGAEILGELVRR